MCVTVCIVYTVYVSVYLVSSARELHTQKLSQNQVVRAQRQACFKIIFKMVVKRLVSVVITVFVVAVVFSSLVQAPTDAGEFLGHFFSSKISDENRIIYNAFR